MEAEESREVGKGEESMILRVPDYFSQFSCIADKCKDSCCIGWEINIDEDTFEYYSEVKGELGQRFGKYMYMTEDGEHSFMLQACGRCPFLNSSNLCDIYRELGEGALSEVCTEYPRFSIEYEDVLQKCLSLSCEEVGRIFFNKTDKIGICEVGSREIIEEDGLLSDVEFAIQLEESQEKMIGILQEKTKDFDQRIADFIDEANRIHNLINETSEEKNIAWLSFSDYSYDNFLCRFRAFSDMEVLGNEWADYKKDIELILNEKDYEKRILEYIDSKDYRQEHMDKLLVYFLFRYFMNSYYVSNAVSYAYLAIMFTLMVRDMNAVRFYKNGGHFSVDDQIDVARIFSKEVEHSEENVELAREEIIFSGN